MQQEIARIGAESNVNANEIYRSEEKTFTAKNEEDLFNKVLSDPFFFKMLIPVPY